MSAQKPYPTAVRVWAGVTAAYGAALLADPALAARLSGGDRVPARWIVVMLGVREISQGALLLIRPTRDLTTAATVVDGLHAASMFAAAGLVRHYRRPALASGNIAAASAAIGMILRRQ